MFNARKNTRGDQIVQVMLKAPSVEDERARDLLRELAALESGDPRKELFEQGGGGDAPEV